MARNSIFLSVLFFLLLSISPSLEDDDVQRFVRNHLKVFGYLLGDHTTVDENFDEALESALRKYQNFYGLNVSGRLEPDTLMMMSRPRCGVPDRPSTENVHNITLQYEFYPGNPKWPRSKMKLKYSFITKTPIPIKIVRTTFLSAFSTWSSISEFTFKEAKGFFKRPNIRIGFYRGEHGDSKPFDGRGGELAHASPPTHGIFHLDADEEWGTVQHENILDLESIAVHEIGHLLGLEHSNVRDAVMFPTFDYGQIKRHLHQDDIDGIHAFYAD